MTVLELIYILINEIQWSRFFFRELVCIINTEKPNHEIANTHGNAARITPANKITIPRRIFPAYISPTPASRNDKIAESKSVIPRVNDPSWFSGNSWSNWN